MKKERLTIDKPFYSVTKIVLIDGEKKIPCVCYKTPASKYDGFLELEKKGTIIMYPAEVRFVSGVPHFIGEATVVQGEKLSAPRAIDEGSADEGATEEV